MNDKTFREIEYQAWSERASQYDLLIGSVSKQVSENILDNLGSLQGKHHLDLACGTGHMVAKATKRGLISEGIDFSPAMVNAARTNYPGESFLVADATDLPYEDAAFDLVTCSFGLTHMENPPAAADQIFRVLNPGGCFAFTLWYGPEKGNEQRAMIKTALEKHATTDFMLPSEWTHLRNANKGACEELTSSAGFGNPVFEILPLVWQARSAQEVIDHSLKLSVRNKLMVERQPVATQQRIYEQILREAQKRQTNGVIPLACPALLTIVQKP